MLCSYSARRHAPARQRTRCSLEQRDCVRVDIPESNVAVSTGSCGCADFALSSLFVILKPVVRVTSIALVSFPLKQLCLSNPHLTLPPGPRCTSKIGCYPVFVTVSVGTHENSGHLCTLVISASTCECQSMLFKNTCLEPDRVSSQTLAPCGRAREQRLASWVRSKCVNHKPEGAEESSAGGECIVSWIDFSIHSLIKAPCSVRKLRARSGSLSDPWMGFTPRVALQQCWLSFFYQVLFCPHPRS